MTGATGPTRRLLAAEPEVRAYFARQVWHRIGADASNRLAFRGKSAGGSFYLLYHFPTLLNRNWRPASMASLADDPDLRAAGAATRSRPACASCGRPAGCTTAAVTGSFLVPVDFVAAERWFWDTLVTDIAINPASWQWCRLRGDVRPIGSSTHHAAEVRSRAPTAKPARATPEQEPFSPWDAGPLTLSAAGIRLGKTPRTDRRPRRRPCPGRQHQRQIGKNPHEKQNCDRWFFPA